MRRDQRPSLDFLTNHRSFSFPLTAHNQVVVDLVRERGMYLRGFRRMVLDALIDREAINADISDGPMTVLARDSPTLREDIADFLGSFHVVPDCYKISKTQSSDKQLSLYGLDIVAVEVEHTSYMSADKWRLYANIGEVLVGSFYQISFEVHVYRVDRCGNVSGPFIVGDEMLGGLWSGLGYPDEWSFVSVETAGWLHEEKTQGGNIRRKLSRDRAIEQGAAL